MEEAVEADRVIVMDKGRKVLEGTPKEVFRNVEKLKEIGLRCSLYDRTSHFFKRRRIKY